MKPRSHSFPVTLRRTQSAPWSLITLMVRSEAKLRVSNHEASIAASSFETRSFRLRSSSFGGQVGTLLRMRVGFRSDSQDDGVKRWVHKHIMML